MFVAGNVCRSSMSPLLTTNAACRVHLVAFMLWRERGVSRAHRAASSSSDKTPYRGHWAEFWRESRRWIAILWDRHFSLLALLSAFPIIYVMFRIWVF